MDLFDDRFAPAATHARAGGKFQPKVKHRPRKQASASAPSVVPSDTEERTGGHSSTSLNAGQSVVPIAVADDKSNIPNTFGSFSLRVNGAEESLKKHEGSVSGVPEGITSGKPSAEVGAPKEDRGSTDVFHQESGVEMTSGVPDGGDGHSGSRPSENEVDLVGLNVDHIIDSGAEPALNSAPSTLPDAIKEKLVTVSMDGLDIGASVQPSDVGKLALEVDSLQVVLDPFNDILSESTTSNTRAGLKFRPKMKPQLQKGATGVVVSALQNTIERSATLPVVDSVRSVQSIDTENGTPTECIDSALATLKILGSREPPENDGYPCSNASVPDNTRSLEVGNSSQLHAPDALQSEVSVPDATGDWHSRFGKSLGENVDIFSGLEYLDDFITQTASATGSEANKSQCKVDKDVQNGDKFLTSHSANNDLGASVSPSEMATRLEENFSAPTQGFFEPSAFTICDVASSQTCSDYHRMHAPVTFSEIAVSDRHKEVQINNGGLETKVSGTLFDFESCEAIVASGKRDGKFQPRPKLGKGKAKTSTSNPQAEVGSALPSEDLHFVPFDNGYVHGDSITEFLHKDVLDCTSARFSDSIGVVPNPEIQGDTEPTNLTEATQSDGTVFDVHSENDLGVLGKGGQSRMEEACPEQNHHGKNEKSSTASQGVEGGKSSMQLRKRKGRVFDEQLDEACDVYDSTCERPTTSNRDEDEDNDDEYGVDGTSRKKKAPRKVKEPVTGYEKPGRKCKSAKEASNDSTKGPPKKFSHSSRRTKRHVDKALLDTPEDEIDPQRLPIRDLILLAEHRERIAIKDAAKLKTPQANQSAENWFHEDASYNEEETFVSEQGQHSDDGQPSYKIQMSALYNHQSYMNKTRGARWSKQETELFYEAIRQFGPVFSQIQLLFPGRTRGQVKLKYKKEESHHPLRLFEAVTNRSKDHSHFVSVIERLREAAAQAKQESDENDSIAVTGEEEVGEVADGTNEGATKTEWDNEAFKDQETHVAEVDNSSLKFDESDDDPDRWGQYLY